MRGNQKKSESWKLRALAVFLSFLTAIGLSEVCLRAVNYRPATMDPNMYERNANELLPYTLRPNYKGYCAGREVKVDPDGYRVIKPSFSESQSDHQARPARTILLLGDSGIFGFGLSDEETIGSQLQKFSLQRNVNYQIRNIGVSGYTSWNEYASFVDYLKKYTATDVVLLYVPNDVTFDNDYFGIGRGKRASFDTGSRKLPRVTQSIYSHLYVSYLISDSLKRVLGQFQRGGKEITIDGNIDLPALDYSMQALGEIQDLCHKRQIRFAVGIYRDIAYFHDSADWLKYEAVIERSLDHQGIKWFVVKSHTDQLSESDVRVAWNDPHPSAKAAGLIAEDILSALTQ